MDSLNTCSTNFMLGYFIAVYPFSNSVALVLELFRCMGEQIVRVIKYELTQFIKEKIP